MADWVLEHYPKTKNVGEPARGQNGEEILRPGIVHRLDRETSGVLLVAKTQKGFDILKKQLIANSFLVTPNIFEAEILAEIKIKNLDLIFLLIKLFITNCAFKATINTAIGAI